MSGLYPSSPFPAESDLESYKPTFQSTANNGKRQARDGNLHLWKTSFAYPVLTREQFEPINGFILSQDGSFDDFQVVLPQKAEPLGVASGSPQVAFNTSAGAKSVLVSGFDGSVNGIMKTGDAIKYDNHSKVYVVTSNANTDSGGNTLLNFRPELEEDVLAGAIIIVTGVEFTMYVEGVHKYNTKSALNASYTVNMVESR